ncbi:amidohydrolase family protein [Hymenobacter sp. CRA2]|uniref:amidohydrolase family protein n=1 Tax=Hymenobacter sp. CRA2 TaxID=1955620 RepID=UPI0009900054|nr:amidohydrolase family protein [Hymenobacter sp. CRA2]OON69948.1 hypothetical protein B0919_04145 [Hymenobacter sp. CRA2]
MFPSRYVQRLLLGSLLASGLTPGQAQQPLVPKGPVVIRNVNVVDVRAGQVISNQQVVIRGGCIDVVGRQAPAGGAVLTIDGRGKYLIPGLWDAHSHALTSQPAADAALAQYLVHGVTGVRDVSSARPRAELAETVRAVDAGERPGPHLVLAGVLDGPGTFSPGARLAHTQAQGRAQVDTQAAAGWACIETRALLPRAAYLGAAEAAAQRRLGFGGDIPEAVTVGEALAAGHRCVAHLDKVLLGCSPRETEIVAARAAILTGPRPAWTLQQHRAEQQAAINADFNPGRCARLAADLVQRGTFVVPLLGADQAESPNGPGTCARWHGAADSTTVALHRQLVAMLHHEGVRLLAGSDAGPQQDAAYGLGLIEELERLVAAGLPPDEALLTATLVPAVLLGRQTELGEVAPAHNADVVLLDANPLDDIRNLRRVQTVIVRGRIYNRAALDALAAEAAKPAATLRTVAR